ncbi:CPBP family intramembrane glutamic endopeptidase [Streptococcus gordonii]|uniref:CPBP family intramembrane glutamic endopeptidase n=1 Tax=Streptococcus gordonii TaxID=1302 RepID=UPI000779356E|nr:type II CAAX endopeptidase family protein [Streptococcus gordonii]
MKKSSILDGVNQARFVPPYILSLLLAVVFVQGGQQLAYLALEPISAVLSFMLGFLGQGGFFEIFFNFALPFLLFGFVFMILALFLWVRWAEGRQLATLGFVKKGSLVGLVNGLAVGFLLFSLVALLMLLSGAGSFEWGQLTLEPFLYILILLPLWMIQGGAEELVTRAWLLPVAVKKTNLPIGLLTSSLLFALLHLGNPDIGILPIINIALFGLFASLYLLRTDNIWGIIGLHAAWNFSQGNIYGFSVSGTDVDAAVLNFIPKSEWSWLTGGAFGAESSIFSSLILLLAVLYLLIKMKKDGSLTGLVGKI